MEEWVSPSASVRRRWGLPWGTDLDTIERYEHTDMELALGEIERPGEVDGGRAKDVQDSGNGGDSVQSPYAMKGQSRRGVISTHRVEPLVTSDRRGNYHGYCTCDIVAAPERESLVLGKGQEISKVLAFQGGLLDT